MNGGPGDRFPSSSDPLSGSVRPRPRRDSMEQPVPISSQFRIMTVLVAIVVILGIVGVLAFRTTTRMIRDREWVAHTQGVLAELQETRALIDDAEDQQRGFLITGDESFLGPFEDNLNRFFSKLQSLRHLDGR